MAKEDKKTTEEVKDDAVEAETPEAPEEKPVEAAEEKEVELEEEDLTEAEKDDLPGAVEVEEEEVEEKVELPDFRSGDSIKIFYKIIEGKKTRIQPYEGIVIARKGKGQSKTFTVRKIGADNVGVERIFPLYSPNITKLEVTRRGKVRRSKLYYLRDKKGRAAIRVKERKAKPGTKAKTA